MYTPGGCTPLLLACFRSNLHLLDRESALGRSLSQGLPSTFMKRSGLLSRGPVQQRPQLCVCMPSWQVAQDINEEVPDEEEPVFDAENPSFDTPTVDGKPSRPPPSDPIDELGFQAEGDPLSPGSRACQEAGRPAAGEDAR